MNKVTLIEQRRLLENNPYLGHFLRLCGNILLQSSYFLLNFHKMCPICSQVYQTVLLRSALGKTPKFDHLGPISSRLKLPWHQIIEYFLDKFLEVNFPFCGTSPVQNSSDGFRYVKVTTFRCILIRRRRTTHLRAYERLFLKMGEFGFTRDVTVILKKN